jgi:hypothetical protein
MFAKPDVKYQAYLDSSENVKRDQGFLSNKPVGLDGSQKRKISMNFARFFSPSCYKHLRRHENIVVAGAPPILVRLGGFRL